MAETSQLPNAPQPSEEVFVNAAAGIPADVGVFPIHWSVEGFSLWNFRMMTVPTKKLSQTPLLLPLVCLLISMRMDDGTMHMAKYLPLSAELDF